ncbi:MAG: DNA polymerase III subunit delta [Candidatus Cloacimonas sp.]|jgi:DNA polymerase III delta subunit|nr:DNA polymerase III subunit delta [Candidatus Cloacimonas sp.]
MNESTIPSALNFSSAAVKLGKSYLLTGTDAYLSDLVLDIIKGTLRKLDSIDTFIVYGDSVKSADLAEQLDTFSIFSSAKLIIIRNAEKLAKKELETLGDYFDAPSEIQSVVVVVEKIDIRFTAWKKIKAGSMQVSCDVPRWGGEIRAWLDSKLGTINKTMTPRAKEEFLNRIELDYYNAANELTKLDLISHGRNQISEKDVMKSLETTRTGTLIDFYRALGRKQAKQAIEAMEKMLFAEWEHLQVFFHFNKFYTTLWRIQLLRKARYSDSEISTKHMQEVFNTQRREYLEFASNYSIKSLESIMAILLETDAQYKLTVAEPPILLTTCLLKCLEA